MLPCARLRRPDGRRVQAELLHVAADAAGEAEGYRYSRFANPAPAVAFSSGTAATSSVLLAEPR